MIRKHPWITAGLGTILLILLCLLLRYSRQTIQQQAMNEAVESLRQVMEDTDRHMHKIEVAADSLIPQIEQHIDQPEKMFAYSRQFVKENPDIKGCSIAFDPHFF